MQLSGFLQTSVLILEPVEANYTGLIILYQAVSSNSGISPKPFCLQCVCSVCVCVVCVDLHDLLIYHS